MSKGLGRTEIECDRLRKTSLSPKGLLDSEMFHVRSASRLSYSDFGVNRARTESMRRRETDV